MSNSIYKSYLYFFNLIILLCINMDFQQIKSKKEKTGADRNSSKLSIGMASNNDDGIWKKKKK